MLPPELFVPLGFLAVAMYLGGYALERYGNRLQAADRQREDEREADIRAIAAQMSADAAQARAGRSSV